MKRAPAFITVLALAACVRAPAPPVPATPTLLGDWKVVSVNGRPSRGTASINPPIYRFDFGCNDGRGNARVKRNRLIVVVPMAVSEKGCMNPDGSPADSMLHEAEGFRIASRNSTATFYGPNRVRLANAAGSIDLMRD